MLNRVQLIGRLGADPELQRGEKYTRCRLSVATDNPGDKDPDWHRVVVWDKQAETCAEYLEKGRLVHVEGEIHYHRYTDKDGIERQGTEIRAFRVVFLPSGGEKREAESRGPEALEHVPTRRPRETAAEALERQKRQRGWKDKR